MPVDLRHRAQPADDAEGGVHQHQRIAHGGDEPGQHAGVALGLSHFGQVTNQAVEVLLPVDLEASRADLDGKGLGLREVEEPTVARSLSRILEDQERELIRAELDRAGGVIARAARALGLERTTLTRRLRQLGLRGGAKPN